MRTIQSACALGRETFAALCFDDSNADAVDDPMTAEQEIVFVAGLRPPPSIKRRTENVRVARAVPTGDVTALLSRLGIVEYLSSAGESLGREDITGARAAGKALPPLGYLNTIACIDDRLFACGMGGQVYARTQPYEARAEARGIGTGAWSLISPGLCSSDIYERWFSNVQGRDRSHILADGDSGLLYLYDGSAWTRVATNTDVAIGEMVFLDDDTVYIAGARSTLLVGAVRTGFRPFRLSHRDLELYTICHYREDVYIGTGEGLFRLQRSREGLLPVAGDIGARDILSLQVVDDVMWCFGPKVVRRFDGETWQAFDQVF